MIHWLVSLSLRLGWLGSQIGWSVNGVWKINGLLVWKSKFHI